MTAGLPVAAVPGRAAILSRFESLEGRQLLSAASSLPDLVNATLSSSDTVSDWGGTVEIEGEVKNQGGGVTTVPFSIEFYASPIRGIDAYSVPIGYVTIPAGLGAGQTSAYETSLTLPSSPIPDVSSCGGTLYIDAVVNPSHTVIESNYANNEDLGPPYDSVPVMIQAADPADLVGTTLVVDADRSDMGQHHHGHGPSHQSRRRSVTPNPRSDLADSVRA